MATFELTAPNGGGTYHIDAPDEHAAASALTQMLGGSKTETPPPAAEAPPASAAPVEQKSTLQSVREAIHAPTRALENGALLGLGDRARALIDSVLGGGGYTKHLEAERADTETFHQAHPIAAPVLEATGGAIAPIAVMKAASVPATLLGKTVAGAGAGGVIGGVQGALGSKDYTDPAQVAKDTAIGTAGGAVIGGLMPGAAKVVGAGYNAAANAVRGGVDGMSRGAAKHLLSAVEADGPAAVQARLAELGPDATLADAGSALLGKAQGASLNSDEGRSILQSTLTKRNEGTNARIQADVEKTLGPKEDSQALVDDILKRRRELDSVAYPAALDNASPVKIAPIMTDLIDRIHNTPVGSNEHKALSKLQDMLTKTEKRPVLDVNGDQVYDRLGKEKWQDVPVSHDSAEVLHKVKQELDNVIEYDAPGLGVPAGAMTRQQAALKQMRHAINDALETQVPGYKSANEVSAMMAKRAEAVTKGTKYLSGEKTTPSPDYFAADYGKLSPDEMIAFQKGSRANIDRVLGVKANDLQALRSELQGEGGWNTAKLATVHGQPAADELAASVDRNLKFRDTHNKVVENSQTAQRNAAAKEMKPDPSSETPLFGPASTITGMSATIAKKGVQGVVNALTRNDPTRHYGEVARALSEQGTARDARLQTIVDALARREGNANAAPTAGNLTAVVAALLGKSGVESLRDNRMQRRLP